MGRFILFAITAILTAGLDLGTKALVEASLTPYQSSPVIDGLFNLTYLKNKGAAFGFLSGSGEMRVPFFIIITLVAMGFILWLLKRHGKERALHLPLGLIFGGAAGNLVDRIRYGSVVDFIDLHWGGYHWPAFNVADAAICIGVVLLLIMEFSHGRKAA
ncbi:MAG: signal peptidase II [Deltaproteobacteria bacterium]|nr:MAG: signal peptidase II [Deltaproteobacteria bacterium]